MLVFFLLFVASCAELNSVMGSSSNYLVLPEADDGRMVVLNTNTHVYHDQKCQKAKSCTKNCQLTTKYAAKASGATPCQKCSGGNK